MLEGIFHPARQAIQSSQSIDDKIGFGVLLDQFLEVFAGGDVIADIHQGNRVVKVLFEGFELVGCPLHMLVAGIQMGAGAIGQFEAGTSEYLL